MAIAGAPIFTYDADSSALITYPSFVQYVDRYGLSVQLATDGKDSIIAQYPESQVSANIFLVADLAGVIRTAPVYEPDIRPEGAVESIGPEIAQRSGQPSEIDIEEQAELATIALKLQNTETKFNRLQNISNALSNFHRKKGNAASATAFSGISSDIGGILREINLANSMFT